MYELLNRLWLRGCRNDARKFQLAVRDPRTAQAETLNRQLRVLAFFFKIAVRVSKSGGWMSVTIPHWNRLTKRLSSLFISLAGRSLDKQSWRWLSNSSLNVWKNSSWVRSLPSRNWMSSISNTSTFRYNRRNESREFSRMARRKLLVNFSQDMYTTFASGLFDWMVCAMACIKCVFPSPVSP